MTRISDVLAFAASHPDYWSELLAGEGEYPEELDQAEVEALDAAVEHIDSELEVLLHGAAECLGQVDSRFTIPRFKAASTRKNRRVVIPPPYGLDAVIYKVEFSAEESYDGTEVQLFPALVAKKKAMEGILARLDERDIQYGSADFHVYGDPRRLIEGQSHKKIIRGLVKSMRTLLLGCPAGDGE